MRRIFLFLLAAIPFLGQCQAPTVTKLETYQINGALNISDTVNKWVQSTFINSSNDSLIVYKNGTRYAYKLPSGTSGTVPTLQQAANAGNIILNRDINIGDATNNYAVTFYSTSGNGHVDVGNASGNVPTALTDQAVMSPTHIYSKSNGSVVLTVKATDITGSTGARTIDQPDSNGRYVLRVNNTAPDVHGNVTIAAGPDATKQSLSEKGQANGYAPLNSAGKIDTPYLQAQYLYRVLAGASGFNAARVQLLLHQTDSTLKWVDTAGLFTGTGSGTTTTNLFASPADFTNAAWTQTNVSISGSRINATTANGNHSISQTITKAATAKQYVLQVDVLGDAGFTTSLVVADNGDGYAYNFFGTAFSGTGGTFTLDNASSVVQGDGYTRYSITFTSSTVTSLSATIYLGYSGNTSFAGTGSTGILIKNVILQESAL